MSTTELIKSPVEQAGKNIKKMAWISVFESVAMLILGIILVVWPDTVVKIFAYVIGLFFTVKGIYQIINYLMAHGYKDYFNNDLLSGIVSAIIGVAFLAIGEEISSVFRIIVGIWIVYGALSRINMAIKMFSAKIASAKMVLLMAILMLVVGAFIVFYNGAASVLIGWVMILAGVISIFEDMIFMQNVDKVVEKITGFFDKVKK